MEYKGKGGGVKMFNWKNQIVLIYLEIISTKDQKD
jgi:hypothetical protein